MFVVSRGRDATFVLFHLAFRNLLFVIYNYGGDTASTCRVVFGLQPGLPAETVIPAGTITGA